MGLDRGPLLFATLIFLSYRIALHLNTLPFLPPREWIWDLEFILCISSGLLAVYLLPIGNIFIKIVCVIIYFSVMLVIFLNIALYVACYSGDCI